VRPAHGGGATAADPVQPVDLATPVKRLGDWTPTDWALTVPLVVFGFFATSSSAGVAIAQALLLLLAIPLWRSVRRLAPWKSPAMGCGLLLLAYITVHSLSFNGWSRVTWHSINRYQELFFAPLMFALLQLAPDRRLFYRSLVSGAFVLALVHWAGLWLPQLDQFLESRRISAGFAFAVLAFMLLMQARTHAHPWRLRALSAFFAVTVLFGVNGRTGYLVLLLLVAAAGWLHSPRRWRWAASVALPVMVLALGWSSSAVQTRLHETLVGAQTDAPVMNTSTGIRKHMLQIAGQLVREHPMLGIGYGNYGEAHKEVVKSMYANDPAAYASLPHTWSFTDNPHNEYLMQLLGGGVPALLLFLAWLGLIVREALCADTLHRSLLMGVCLAFAVGCLFNSLLMDFVEGHLYMGLLAWLLACMAQPRPAPLPTSIQRAP
jgi:O-antigen ligase